MYIKPVGIGAHREDQADDDDVEHNNGGAYPEEIWRLQ
jgi:hypothetical protein